MRGFTCGTIVGSAHRSVKMQRAKNTLRNQVIIVLPVHWHRARLVAFAVLWKTFAAVAMLWSAVVHTLPGVSGSLRGKDNFSPSHGIPIT